MNGHRPKPGPKIDLSKIKLPGPTGVAKPKCKCHNVWTKETQDQINKTQQLGERLRAKVKGLDNVSRPEDIRGFKFPDYITEHMAAEDSLTEHKMEMARRKGIFLRLALGVKDNMKLGPWTYNSDTLTIDHDNGYQIDLEQCTTSAEVLDWICQIAEKTWGSEPAVLGQLVLMINNLLRPQATLCSSGQESGPLNVQEMLEGDEVE